MELQAEDRAGTGDHQGAQDVADALAPEILYADDLDALDDDQQIRRALTATSNIEFYRYQIRFNLLKA